MLVSKKFVAFLAIDCDFLKKSDIPGIPDRAIHEIPPLGINVRLFAPADHALLGRSCDANA
jgi:hypothetical protein